MKMTNGTGGLGHLERVLGRVSAARKGGPLCIVTAGIHGNEPAGVHALRRVFHDIAARQVPLHGRFVALSGNRSGLERGVRFVDEDMNRVWSASRVAALRTRDPRLDNSEEREQRELLGLIDAELALGQERVTHFDLHSTSGGGPPFTVIAGPESSRGAANNLGVPLLLGLEAIIAGTLIEYLGSLGHTTVLLEGGQNEARATIDHHESAVWLMLVASGVVKPGDVPDSSAHRTRLQNSANGLPNELEIAYCHHLAPGEEFKMLPGYASFDAVTEGQLLARSGPNFEREVRAPWTGTLLMPRYQGQGLDGFFLGRRIARAS
jgi:predicted deacylase